MKRSREAALRKVRRQLRRVPALDPVVDRVGVAAWKLEMRRRAGDQDWVVPGRVIEIDPRSVHHGLHRLDLLEALGISQRSALDVVHGGDWDLGVFDLETELGIFGAVRERYVDGKEWEEISFFDEMKEALRRGEPKFKYRSLEDFPRQMERIDDLCESIRQGGYRSQPELDTQRPWDEIVIAIDRDGRPIFVDGRHRLAIARALGLASVPVVVALRHSRWVDAVGQFLTHLDDHSHGRSYQPVPHPDLAFIPSLKGDERFEMIRHMLPVSSGRVLDIGANKGYFSHRFEAVGFECYAAERSERELHFLELFRKASNRRFTVVRGDVLHADPLPHFDVVLALNIFHHFVKTEEGTTSLEHFLRRLSVDHIVFEPHVSADPQMRGAHWNPEPSEFAGAVAGWAGLSAISVIGTAEDGRTLYLLSRENDTQQGG